MKFMEPVLLAVFAHPDDESFAAGGTLAKYAAAGIRVILVSATRGEAGIAELDAADTARLREVELRAAAGILGVSRLEFLDYLDGQLEWADEKQVANRLIEIFRQEKPGVVITFGPDGISGHPDHVAIHHFVTRAFAQARLSGRLYYLMPSEATQQGCGIPPSREVAGGPVVAVDVGAHLVTKVRAMQAHASQDPPYPGDPVEEAGKLACHEYFTLARPVTTQGQMSDLFTD